MSEKPVIDIRADHRERASGVLKLLQDDPEVRLTVEVLPHGDFVVAPNTIIERKAAVDLVNSIRDARLFQQHKVATEAGQRVLFLIEGDPYATRADFHVNSLVGAVSWMFAIENCPVVHTPSPQHTALMVKMVARHLQHGLYAKITMHPPKPKSVPDLQLYLVQSLPGVGEAKARALLDHFGSPAAVFAASFEQLCEVPGIAKGVASMIRSVLE